MVQSTDHITSALSVAHASFLPKKFKLFPGRNLNRALERVKHKYTHREEISVKNLDPNNLIQVHRKFSWPYNFYSSGSLIVFT